MKKFTTAIAAAAFSASMIASAGIATAQIPDAMPEECPAGQHFENAGGTFQCVPDKEAPQPEQNSPDGIPAPMPEKCAPGQHFENVGGTFQCVPDKEAPQPEAPGNNEPQPGDLGNPGITDKQCPEGEHFDMSKPVPSNPNVYGVCVKDETKPDNDKPDADKPGNDGKDGKPGKDVKVNVDIKISAECKTENKCTKEEKKAKEKAEKKASESKKTTSSKDVKKVSESKKSEQNTTESKKASSNQSTGLAATGVDAATLGGAALVLLVGGVAATRIARKNR